MKKFEEDIYSEEYLLKKREMFFALKSYIKYLLETQNFKSFFFCKESDDIIKKFRKLFRELNIALKAANKTEETMSKFMIEENLELICKKICIFIKETMDNLSTNFYGEILDICEYYSGSKVYKLKELYPKYDKQLSSIITMFKVSFNLLNLTKPKKIVEAINTYNELYDCTYYTSNKASYEYIIHTAELEILRELYIPLKKMVNIKNYSEEGKNLLRYHIYYINKLLFNG